MLAELKYVMVEFNSVIIQKEGIHFSTTQLLVPMVSTGLLNPAMFNAGITQTDATATNTANMPAKLSPTVFNAISGDEVEFKKVCHTANG